MTGIAVHVEHVPTIDHLEHNADLVIKELAKIAERASDLFGRMQDVDVELASDALDPEAAGGALAVKHEVAYELRKLARLLHRAQLHLVTEADDRHKAAQEALGWLDEAERDDRPWKVAA